MYSDHHTTSVSTAAHTVNRQSIWNFIIKYIHYIELKLIQIDLK
jgi:hypothetical protein